jgi:regulation of enolase protein 1 (concanavalin A-like superfamily)
MGGSGGDVWGTADAFGFTWRTLQGDGEIVARITGQSNTNPFAKAGLMIRESASDPSSAGVLVDVKPNHEVELLTREASGGPTSYLGGTVVQSDSVWLKLTRAGDVVTGFVSIDGTTWIAGGSTPFTSPSAAFGFAVTSHDNTALNQAVFDDWSITEIQTSAGPLDRSDWTVVATESSPSDPPEQAIDGDLATRFSTGNAQHDSQGFIVSWPEDRSIGRIRMEVGPSTGDYPRTCGIWVKDTVGSVTIETVDSSLKQYHRKQNPT